jgi:hypothetical protein
VPTAPVRHTAAKISAVVPIEEKRSAARIVARRLCSELRFLPALRWPLGMTMAPFVVVIFFELSLADYLICSFFVTEGCCRIDLGALPSSSWRSAEVSWWTAS